MEDGRVHLLLTPKHSKVLPQSEHLIKSPVAVFSRWLLHPHCLPNYWHLGMAATEAHSPSPVARTQTCTHTCAYTHIHTIPHNMDHYSLTVFTWILLCPHTDRHAFTRVFPIAGPDLWSYQQTTLISLWSPH